MMVSFVLSFFPRDVLDEILNLIESVSEDFPSYSLVFLSPFFMKKILVVLSLGFMILGILFYKQNLDSKTNFSGLKLILYEKNFSGLKPRLYDYWNFF